MKKSINLIPKSYYENLDRQAKKTWISAWGFLAIFIVVAVSSLFIITDLISSNIYASKVTEARKLYSTQSSLSLVLSKAQSVSNRSKAIQQIAIAQKDYDGLVQQVIALPIRVPISYRGFNSKSSTIEISAVTPDIKNIAVFMNVLSNNDKFKNPSLVGLFPQNINNTNSNAAAGRSWQFTIAVNI